MVIVVDLNGPRLTDEDVFDQFYVSGTGNSQTLAESMGVAGEPCDEGDHVWVSVAWLREQGRSDHAWNADFERMVAFAVSKGWANPSATLIKAHIEAP